MTVSIMKTILGRQYAAPASSTLIGKPTVKEITLVLNRDTQLAHHEGFSADGFLSPRIKARRFAGHAKKWPGRARP
ncbi:hypothetical protein [Bradyrhizobium guangdongense]|uniref:hypothetical protein n=1 Tax=Bradyrhizobium guangdongense TaxID=1325090 RepID=UPI001009E0F9|nr:hypothetical protein [Bradyrhizobium guangdongense]